MERQYLITERAHYMCPNMHFAIMAEIKSAYNQEKAKDVLNQQATAHPFLRALIKKEEKSDKLFYDIQKDSQIHFEEVTDSRTYADIMNDISQNEWNVFQNGLLKVFVLLKEENPKLLFVAHHLLCDGRGLLKLVAEFSDAYVIGKDPIPSDEILIAKYEDLPNGSRLPWMSRTLVRNANKTWKKENRKVDYDLYAEVSNAYGKAHKNVYEEKGVVDTELQTLIDKCHKNSISINDYLCAEFCHENAVHKLILAADIRTELPFYQEGALGNYATAFSIAPKCKGTVIEKAKEIQKLSKKVLSNNAKKMLVLACYLEMEPTLLDAAAISALGGFESKAGKFVGTTMFSLDKPSSYSVTNLGRIKSESMISAMFIPPSSLAVITTMGVVTVNNRMQICYSKTEKR